MLSCNVNTLSKIGLVKMAFSNETFAPEWFAFGTLIFPTNPIA